MVASLTTSSKTSVLVSALKEPLQFIPYLLKYSTIVKNNINKNIPRQIDHNLSLCYQNNISLHSKNKSENVSLKTYNFPQPLFKTTSLHKKNSVSLLLNSTQKACFSIGFGQNNPTKKFAVASSSNSKLPNNDFQKLESLLEKTENLDSKILIQKSYIEGFKEAINRVKAEPEKKPSFLGRLLALYFPFFFGISLFIHIVKSIYSNSTPGVFNQANKEHSQMHTSSTTFSNVCGIIEAKYELNEVVNFLTNPSKYTSIGAKLPKGILFHGPPGNGKTLLARALAGEAGVPFFHISGSQFEEKFVGTGAARVRELFSDAKKNSPCVIFIDEIDAVGGKRTSSDLYPYASQTINQLLSEMDGFVANSGVVVVGATNRMENLDPALLRAGRFDTHIYIGDPDVQERKEILEYYIKLIHNNNDIDVEKFSKITSNFSASELTNLVNQAALHAASKNKVNVDNHDFSYAFDKLKMGPAKASRIPDEKINWATAVHEAGHALTAHYTKGSNPINKITILARGSSLGHTAFIPDNEYSTSKAQMNAMVDTALGGRAAEEVVFGKSEVKTGCYSDFEVAKNMMDKMVNKLGMDENNRIRCSSDENCTIVEENINLSYERVLTLLKRHKSELIAVAQCLLQYETLNYDQFLKAIKRVNGHSFDDFGNGIETFTNDVIEAKS